MRELSRAADHSKLSLAAAGLLALAGGPTGRRAAACGLVSVGLTSALVNVAVKPISRRRRPDRVAERVSLGRQVRMPISTSFPSGHSAAAFAFATGVGPVMPRAAVPLRALAALVAYSRVHTGVHYPGDAVVGSLIGGAVAQIAVHELGQLGDAEIGHGATVSLEPLSEPLRSAPAKERVYMKTVRSEG